MRSSGASVHFGAPNVSRTASRLAILLRRQPVHKRVARTHPFFGVRCYACYTKSRTGPWATNLCRPSLSVIRPDGLGPGIRHS